MFSELTLFSATPNTVELCACQKLPVIWNVSEQFLKENVLSAESNLLLS